MMETIQKITRIREYVDGIRVDMDGEYESRCWQEYSRHKRWIDSVAEGDCVLYDFGVRLLTEKLEL